MPESHEFLKSLTVVLAVAAITTVLFQKLRLPIVLGYILAGLIVGPHVPVPLVADREVVHILSELGVILLMFSLGLEFSLRRLVRLAPTAGVAAVFQSSVMMWLGFLVAQAFGWTTIESIFTGAVIAVSSTTIIAKVFAEKNIGGPLRELVVGILLVEDLISVLLMAALTAVATGAGLSPARMLPTVGALVAFLVGLTAIGMLVVPRFIRLVSRMANPETTVVTSIGLCFVIAWIALAFGYSVALGAFLAGSLVAESGPRTTSEVEHLVKPVKDVFLAVFFVSVGLSIDPALVVRDWRVIAVLTVVIVLGKLVTVSVGAFLAGSSIRTSVQSGMSLAQVGEFSFIIASLGITLGVTGAQIYSAAVAVSAITTMTTPWLISAAEPVAAWVDRRLPRGFQTFAALYGSWIERLRAPRDPRAGPGRLARLLALDAVLLAALIIVASLGLTQGAASVSGATGLGLLPARGLLVILTVGLALPLVAGIGRLSRRLAELALPRKDSGVDLDLAPRRSLSITLQLAVTLVTLFLVLAGTAPFLPGYSLPVTVLVVLAGFGIAIWRSTRNLEGHVRAGSQAVVQTLTKYARAGDRHSTPMVEVRALFAGMGDPVAIVLPADAPAAGKSLAELNLRGRTGATVLAIARSDAEIVAPGASEVLCADDRIALAGSAASVEAARRILMDETAPERRRMEDGA